MVVSDIPDDSNERTDAKGLAAMTAQILNFPARNTSTEEIASPVASDYVQVATRLIESASVRGYDLTRLARAIMSAVEAQSARDAASVVTTQPAAQPEHRDKFRGTKYDRDLDVVEIAKVLRKDLAVARKTTLVMLPAYAKISVTTNRYSMGCSLTVRIKGLTAAEKWNAPGTSCHGGRTPLCLNAMQACRDLMNAYLRDNSDTMTDYYDVNFSGDVVVD